MSDVLGKAFGGKCSTHSLNLSDFPIPVSEYITVAEDPDASAAASSSRTTLATPVTTAPHVPPASYQHQGQNVYQTNPSYLQPHVPPPASLGQFYNTQQPVLNTTSAQLNNYNAPAPMSQYPPQYAWSPSLQPQSAPLTQWGQNVQPSISAQPSHPGYIYHDFFLLVLTILQDGSMSFLSKPKNTLCLWNYQRYISIHISLPTYHPIIRRVILHLQTKMSHN